MVPDGLAGERVDVGISRMLGLSRTRAAELVMDGLVLVDGQAPGTLHPARAGGDGARRAA